VSTFRFQLAASLDGFVAGPDQSEENPLGFGARLFEEVGDLNLEQVRAIEAPGVTHIKYRVVTAARVAQPYRVPPMGLP
jgi:hypothetical protein